MGIGRKVTPAMSSARTDADPVGSRTGAQRPRELATSRLTAARRPCPQSPPGERRGLSLQFSRRVRAAELPSRRPAADASALLHRDGARARGRRDLCRLAGVRAPPRPARGRRLCRGDPQHAAPGAALPRLLRPAEPRHQARRDDGRDHRADGQSRRLCDRDRARRPRGDPARPDRGRGLARAVAPAGVPLRRAVAGAQGHVPGARQPVHPADAGDERRLADLGAGPLPHRLDHPVAHLPRLRGLHRRRGALSRAGARLPLAFAGLYQLAFARR